MNLRTNQNQNTWGHLSVLVSGAGPAGLGVATVLKQTGVRDTLIIDAREIGASFMKWPR